MLTKPAPAGIAQFWKADCHTVTGKDKEDNSELVAGEIESLQSILTEQELKIVEPTSVLTQSEIGKYQIANVLLFSIAPNFAGKIFAKDVVQKMQVDLRKLPCLEFYAALTADYPSCQAPLISVLDGFYSQYREKLAEQMAQLWQEGMPCLYDVFITMQDGCIESLLAEFPDQFPQDEEGNIRLEYPNAKSFQTVFEHS